MSKPEDEEIEEEEGEDSYPALRKVEEIASIAILASISVIFMSIFLLILLQLQLVAVLFPIEFFGIFLSVVIIGLIGYLTPKIFRYGVMIFGSYWDMARREDIGPEGHSEFKETLSFAGFALLGLFSVYMVEKFRLNTIDVPDMTLLSIISSNPDPLTLTEVFLLELASTGSIVLLVAPGFTVLYRLKLRFLPTYYCPKCGMKVDVEYQVCPYCQSGLEEPVSRRPYYRNPFEEEN